MNLQQRSNAISNVPNKKIDNLGVICINKNIENSTTIVNNLKKSTVEKKKNKKKKKKRCFLGCCNKKLKLTDIKCGKCNNQYCSSHRLPEVHECSWNPRGNKEMKQFKKLSGLDNATGIFSKVDKL
jgi:predicted nucleic acid binding AN1-type Zn finger protein